MNNSLKREDVDSVLELIERNGVFACISPVLEKYRVKHMFSTRLGGVSEGEYSALNLSWKHNDLPDNIKQNYILAAAAIDTDAESIVFSEQTHSNIAAKASSMDKNMLLPDKKLVAGVDALITDCKGITLTARTADCVPILMFDRKKEAIAAIHSGWKGTVKNILYHTVLAMKKEYGSDVKDIIAVIGPAIGPCCFLVDDDVAGQFVDAGYDYVKKAGEKYSIDLGLCCAVQLDEIGLLRENVTLSSLCTSCRQDLFFSHRRDKGKTGGMAAFIALG